MEETETTTVGTHIVEVSEEIADGQDIRPRFDLDDKDLAMAGIVILAIGGGILLAIFVEGSAAAVGGLFTGGITALGSLATGRKKSQ